MLALTRAMMPEVLRETLEQVMKRTPEASSGPERLLMLESEPESVRMRGPGA